MLQTVGWDLHLATPMDFVKVFLGLGILFSDDKVRVQGQLGVTEMPTTKTLHYTKKYCEFFADLCLQEYEFQKYDSETLAVSIILCARKGVKISPVWNAELSTLTSKTYEDVQECYRKIYTFYQKSFPTPGSEIKEEKRINVKRQASNEKKLDRSTS